MIDADSYLTQLVGYIHLNPVRAGMVARCEEYEWSSHQTYVGNNIIPWLTTETVLSQFSGNAANGRRLFHEFVRDQQEGHNPEFHGAGGFDSRIFGGDQVQNLPEKCWSLKGSCWKLQCCIPDPKCLSLICSRN